MNSPAYGSRPPEAETWDALTELALDVRWSYNHSTDTIWERMDPELRDLTSQPLDRIANSVLWWKKVQDSYH